MKGVLMYSARTNNMMYFDCNCHRRIYVYETSNQCFVYFQSFFTQIFSFAYFFIRVSKSNCDQSRFVSGDHVNKS